MEKAGGRDPGAGGGEIDGDSRAGLGPEEERTRTTGRLGPGVHPGGSLLSRRETMERQGHLGSPRCSGAARAALQAGPLPLGRTQWGSGSWRQTHSGP